MALRQIVETVIAAREIVRRRICILSGSYAELPGVTPRTQVELRLVPVRVP